MFVLAIYCKAVNFSFGETIQFVRDLATFSMMRNVGREAQKNFWSSHAEYKGIRILKHEHFAGISESPFKLTFTRCLWAATCLVPTASDLAPLHVKDESVAPKLIARVCRLQMDAGEVKVEGGSTSTSEHLLHKDLKDLEAFVLMYNSRPLAARRVGCRKVPPSIYRACANRNRAALKSMLDEGLLMPTMLYCIF